MHAMPIMNLLCSAAHTAAVTPVCRQCRLTEQNGNLMVDLKFHEQVCLNAKQIAASLSPSQQLRLWTNTFTLHVIEHVKCGKHLS